MTSAFAAGFSLPGSILFGALLDLLKIRSSCFMLLYGVVWVSMILLYFSEVKRAPILGNPLPGRITPGQPPAQAR